MCNGTLSKARGMWKIRVHGPGISGKRLWIREGVKLHGRKGDRVKRCLSHALEICCSHGLVLHLLEKAVCSPCLLYLSAKGTVCWRMAFSMYVSLAILWIVNNAAL